MHDPYVRKCKVVRVVDGDTLHVEIDLGFLMLTVQKLRLLGLQAPEPKGATRKAGEKSKLFVISWLNEFGCFDPQSSSWSNLFIHTQKSDDFGRWLAEISEPKSAGTLNAALLNSGNAVPFMVAKEKANAKGVN